MFKYLRNLFQYSNKVLCVCYVLCCFHTSARDWWTRWCACVQTCLECSLPRRWPGSNPDSVWKPRHFSKKAGKKINLCAEPGRCCHGASAFGKSALAEFFPEKMSCGGRFRRPHRCAERMGKKIESGVNFFTVFIFNPVFFFFFSQISYLVFLQPLNVVR